MKLYKVNLQQIKGKLNNDEKALLAYMGNLHNEIIFLLNAYLCTKNAQKENAEDVIKIAQLCQGQFFIELLAGKLWEGRKIFNFEGIKLCLSKTYYEKMDSKKKHAIKNLKRKIDKSDWLKKIRNKYANHYDNKIADDLSKKFDDMKAHDLCLFASKTNANSLYYFAELAMLQTMTGADDAKADDAESILKTLKDVFQEVIDISRAFLTCIGYIFNTALKIHGIDESAFEEIDIPDPPSYRDRELPYFLKL